MADIGPTSSSLAGDPVPQGPGTGATDAEQIKAIPVRHRGRWVAAIVILVLVAMLVHWLAFPTWQVYPSVSKGSGQNPLQWDVVWHYLFSSQIVTGVVITIELTVIAMVIGIVSRASSWR